MKSKSRSFSIEVLVKYLADRGVTGNLDEIARDLASGLDAAIADVKRRAKNAQRIRENDDRKEHQAAGDCLTSDQLARLPSWVREQVDHAKIIGKTGDVIQVSDGRKFHLKNSLNDLSGAEWTFFLSSVLNTRFPTTGPESFAHEIRKIHPSPKPPQLMKSIIEFFTKENELVFDYFMGVGGSLLGASLCGRAAVGVDLNPEFVQAYRSASQMLELPEQRATVGDSVQILSTPDSLYELVREESAALILIDPPYGDMMARSKTGEATKHGLNASPTPFTQSDADLGNMPIPEFVEVFRDTVKNSLRVLKDRGHVVVFMKDLQPTADNTNLLHADVINALNSLPNLRYVGMKIWADQGVNLYPYGYPYSFVANQIHQFILVFRKT